MADETEKRLAALEAKAAVQDNKIDNLEKRQTSTDGKLWTGIMVILVFVANQILGLLPWGKP